MATVLEPIRSSFAVERLSKITQRRSLRHGAEGFNLTVQSLSIKSKAGIPILQDVNASFPQGELVAIIGPSGCGKSSLLRVLAGRCSGELIQTGSILLNGAQASKSELSACTAFMQQNDCVWPQLTPKEVIRFHAETWLSHQPHAEREQLVDELLKELELTNCQDNMIGLPDQSPCISGGERRRTAFACEMVTNPSFLLCDEPTSGLDSDSALVVTKMLQQLARTTALTVLLVIHQPSSDIFALFDRVILMANGTVVFSGNPDQAVSAFELQGFQRQGRASACEFLVQALKEAKEAPISAALSLASLKRKFIPELTHSHLVRASPACVRKTVTQRASTVRQVKLLARRQFRIMYRDRLQVQAPLVAAFLMCLFVGLLYVRMKHDQSGIQNTVGSLYLLLLSLGFALGGGAATTISMEKPYLMAEYKKGMYSMHCFAFVRASLEIIYGAIGQLAFVPSYYIIGYQSNPKKLAMALLLTFLASDCTRCMYSCCGILIPAQSATLLANLIGFLLGTFSGLFVNLETSKPYISWISKISQNRYGLEGLMHNELIGRTFYCSSDQLSNGSCPITTGIAAYRFYGFSFPLWKDLVVLAALLIGWRLVLVVAYVLAGRHANRF